MNEFQTLEVNDSKLLEEARPAVLCKYELAVPLADLGEKHLGLRDV